MTEFLFETVLPSGILTEVEEEKEGETVPFSLPSSPFPMMIPEGKTYPWGMQLELKIILQQKIKKKEKKEKRKTKLSNHECNYILYKKVKQLFYN